MPRKTRYELQAEREVPAPGTEAYWKAKKLEASAKKAMMDAAHRKMQIDRMTGDLISRGEVREMFTRVFSAFRRAIQEIDRRYGSEAAALLIEALRSALRVQQEEETICQSSTPSSGKDSEQTSPPNEALPNSRSKKS